MGKVRINTIGSEEAEKKQKIKAEKRKVAKAQGDNETKKEEKVAKEPQVSPEVQSVVEEPKQKPSVAGKKAANTPVAKRSTKYQAAVMKVDKAKVYALAEALELLPHLHLATFDETVELHVNTHETGISGNVSLPHGTGKQIRVAILAPSKDQQAADELLKQIESGNINFDVLIATPDAMPKLAKVARILGPRGLMPNPKNGTVTQKPDEVAKSYAGGQIHFKTESKTPVIHLSVGKLSFKKEQLMENIKVVLNAVQNKNIKNVTLKSTMSPGIKIQL